MNILEGARRIQKVGRVAMFFAMATSSLCLIFEIVATHIPSIHPLSLMPLIILLCVYPSLLGGIFLVVGWIVEGFAMPSRSRPSGD